MIGAVATGWSAYEDFTNGDIERGLMNGMSAGDSLMAALALNALGPIGWTLSAVGGLTRFSPPS